MTRRVLFGGLAALCVALVGLDATMFKPSDYPLLRKFFDGDWEIVRNSSFAALSALAALFGYFALNANGGSK